MRIDFSLSYNPALIQYLARKAESDNVTEAEEAKGITKETYRNLYNAVMTDQGYEAPYKDDGKDLYDYLFGEDEESNSSEELLMDLNNYYWQF